MTFENSSAAWWALVAVPVFILYLARLNVHRETIGTGMFWRCVLPKTSPLVRRIASLLAQLMLIGLMVAALAKLYLSPDVGSRRFVLIVDNSPSMSAESEGKSRLSLAIEQANALVNELRIGDEAAVYVTSPVTRAVCGMTRSRHELSRRLEGIKAADQGGDLDATINLAQKVIKLDNNARVLVISDACDLLPKTTTSDEVVTFLQVGDSQDNAALTRLAARKSLTGDAVEVMIEVRSYSDETAEFPIVMTLDGAMLAREEVELPANHAWNKTFRLSGTAGGQLSAHIEREDGLAADNELVVDLPTAKMTNVKVYGEETTLLNDALAALPRIRIVESEKRSPDVAVFYKQNPPVDLDTPALVIGPIESGPKWQVGSFQYDVSVAQNNSSHLLREVSLADAVYERVRMLNTESLESQASHVAAVGKTATGEEFPILVGFDTEPRQVVLGVELDNSDLAHRRDLPRLLNNAIQWLAPQSQDIAIATSTMRDHDLRPQEALSGVIKEVSSNPLDYPWWHWPCWYLSLALALALLPLEWWLYQRRIIA